MRDLLVYGISIITGGFVIPIIMNWLYDRFERR